MNNSQNLPQKSEPQDLKVKSLQSSIALAIERTGTTPFKIGSMVNDVLDEFKNIEIDRLVLAIRNGSLGMYGETFKLTTQVLCVWIRKYQKDDKDLIDGRPRFLEFNGVMKEIAFYKEDGTPVIKPKLNPTFEEIQAMKQ